MDGPGCSFNMVKHASGLCSPPGSTHAVLLPRRQLSYKPELEGWTMSQSICAMCTLGI